jgi:hypothetical protein
MVEITNKVEADSEEAAEVVATGVDSEAMIDVVVIDAVAIGKLLRPRSRSKRGLIRSSMATGRKVASRSMVRIVNIMNV